MYTRKWGGVDFWVRKEKEIRIEREISLLKKTLEVFSKLSELYLNEMASMGQNWPELGQNGPKRAKKGQIGPNWAKMGQNRTFPPP